ncbi:MAG: hypothetical protein M3N98_15840, partial [Actinomycetota bacterium]|nr:hypothetical protein [Actinomycetota bacterium]
PGRKPDERVLVLKRWVRWAVTAWVLVVVPLLAFELLTVLIHLPRILATAGASADKLWHDIGKAFSDGQAFNAVSDILQLIVLAIPILGIVLMIWRFAKQAAVWAWKHTAGRPVRRALAGMVAAGCVVLLALAWIPKHNYRSIQPHERGTFGEGVVALRYLPQHPAQLDRRATAHDLKATTSTTVPALQSSSPTTPTTPTTSALNGRTATTLPRGVTATTLAGGYSATTLPARGPTSTVAGVTATTLPVRQTLPPQTLPPK